LDIPSLGRREHSLTLNGAYRTEQISTELDLRFSIARKPAFTEVCMMIGCWICCVQTADFLMIRIKWAIITVWWPRPTAPSR